jgi:hypothetical protein
MEFNWQDIIDQTDKQSGYTFQIMAEKGQKLKTDKSLQVFKNLEKAGLNYESVTGWSNFMTGVNIDLKAANYFSKIVNKNHVKSWLSLIKPGHCVPWHWDIDEHDWGEFNDKHWYVYTIWITEPRLGQVLIVDNQHYYMKPKNFIVEWPSYDAYHACINLGFENCYLYTFVGVDF